jgi:hypothetical protein
MKNLEGFTAYQKNLVAWACIMSLGFLFGALFMYASSWFMLPFFAVVGVAPFFLNRIVCPNCGTPVTYQGTIAGLRIRGGFIRKKCQQCGWDLRKNP